MFTGASLLYHTDSYRTTLHESYGFNYFTKQKTYENNRLILTNSLFIYLRALHAIHRYLTKKDEMAIIIRPIAQLASCERACKFAEEQQHNDLLAILNPIYKFIYSQNFCKFVNTYIELPGCHFRLYTDFIRMVTSLTHLLACEAYKEKAKVLLHRNGQTN